jgi:hypothetical protein
MQFKEAHGILLRNPLFMEWQKENPDHFLAHGFIMSGGEVVPEWQIGYYNKREDRIIVFVIGETVTQNPPSELFKKDSGVRELFIDEITTDSDEALAAAEALRATKYKGHEPLKTMILLQHLQRGQLWNVTFVTNTFSVCNIKLDAKTLDILSDSCETLLGWGQAVPGNRK